jgi:hypothetical protein
MRITNDPEKFLAQKWPFLETIQQTPKTLCTHHDIDCLKPFNAILFNLETKKKPFMIFGKTFILQFSMHAIRIRMLKII